MKEFLLFVVRTAFVASVLIVIACLFKWPPSFGEKQQEIYYVGAIRASVLFGPPHIVGRALMSARLAGWKCATIDADSWTCESPEIQERRRAQQEQL